jgi:hypothetical protein
LTLGVRADAAKFPDSPSFNPIVQNAIGFSTASTPSEDVVFSPRGDIFSAHEAPSSFEVEHRFNVAASYNFRTGPPGHTVALFYKRSPAGPTRC